MPRGLQCGLRPVDREQQEVPALAQSGLFDSRSGTRRSCRLVPSRRARKRQQIDASPLHC